MTRQLTPEMLKAIAGQQTDEVFIVLVTFTYDIRFTGNLYVGAPLVTDLSRDLTNILSIGDSIAGDGITPGATITNISSDMLIMSDNATVSVNTVGAVMVSPITLRFSSDPTVRHSLTPLVYKTVSNGNDYYYVPMAIQLPTDSPDSPTTAQLSVSNVGLELINILRSMIVGDVPATVDLNIVLASDPDNIGFTVPTLDMVQADWDEQNVTMTLVVEALDREPFPADSFTPTDFPALF